MNIPPLPPNEADRLKALESYKILDTLGEQAFDDLTALAAHICGTPIALISLVDAHRQWFKSTVGLEATETPRDLAFCAHAILQPDQPLIVPNALEDERFATNPLVTSDPNIRFYAGTPLVTPQGYALGTICTLDRVPRQLESKQIEALQVLSRQVVTQLELRLNLFKLVQTNEVLRQSEERFRLLVEGVKDYGIFMLAPDGRIVSWNNGAQKLKGYSTEEIVGQHFSCFYTTEDSKQGKPEQNLTVAAYEGRLEDEGWRVRQDGTRFWANVVITALHDEAGKLCGFAKVTRDLTERQQVETALRASEERYRTLFEDIPSMYFTINKEATVLSVNKFGAQQLGYTVEELIGQPGLNIIHEDDKEFVLQQFITYLQNPTQVAHWESRKLCKDGSVLWVKENVRAVKDADGQTVVLFSCQDITDRKRTEDALQKAKDELEIKVEERTRELRNTNKQLESEIVERQQAEAALKESEERYALAVRGAKDGLWDWNLKTNQVYFSSRWKSLLGREDEIDNSLDEWLKHIHPEDTERVKVEIATHLEGLTPHFESEHRILHKDGTYRWMLSRGLAVRDANGKASRMAGSQTDITQRKLAEEQLLHDAFHDALTGLPNRALFMDRLGHAVERVKRHEDSLFAVLFIDLDRFKVVNDSLGHMSGDQLLIRVVQRLKHCLRAGDTVARLGGDEFTILLEDIKDISEATAIAQRIQAALTSPFSLSGHEVFITASIGIVLSTTGYERLEDILRDADTAMYRAKAQGKACHQVFDKTMHIRAVTLLQLENDLRRAVMSVCHHKHERTEARLPCDPEESLCTGAPGEMVQDFLVHYQPIVSLATGRVKGFEALLRWQHPERGLVSPAEFIPIAEETGLIVPLGYWVLRCACRQMRAWQERFPTSPPLTISVNLSTKQFSQPDLIGQIDQILRETGLGASSLQLEITESAIMENAETADAMLLQLRTLGIQLYVDDFGTGYSSLSYLQRFPVNALKIDRSFISKMGVDGEDSGLVQTIVMLAHKLGIGVVAEGVETAEQLAQLRALCCTQGQGQGYFFSKPLDSIAAEALIVQAPQW